MVMTMDNHISVDPAADPDAEAQWCVERAREAAVWWAALSWQERRRRLLCFKSLVVQGIAELTELVHTETGKPVDDVVLETVIAIEHVDWAAKHARRVLRRRRLWPGVMSVNQSALRQYDPLGVVGVIGPYNYPVFTPMSTMSHALAAGNTVVLKPSEHAVRAGSWLADRFAEAVPEHPVVQILPGGPEAGAALCRSGVDKIAFTGSTATAHKIMAECAGTLTPMLIEAGGKDALIVAADADLDAAAETAVWGGMSNAGQTCVGVERVYVVADVYEDFLDRVRTVAEALRPGLDPASHFGPIMLPQHVEVIREHIREAIARGARIVVGGEESVQPPFVGPVVLAEVPGDTRLMTEETFGPVLAVNPVRDLDEAVERANETAFGLAGSVFTRNAADGVRLASRLRNGATSINAMGTYVGVPALPFGGAGDSGFGRNLGADGLREFARVKSITRQRFRLPLNLMSFRRTEADIKLVLKMTALRHGRRRAT